jgi:hypothetical protein
MAQYLFDFIVIPLRLFSENILYVLYNSNTCYIYLFISSSKGALMSITIFSTYSESIPLSHIVYVGSVFEISAEHRKGENTHAFKIVTSSTTMYCNYKDTEAAKIAHDLLEKQLGEHGKKIFKNAGDLIDVSRITSFSKVVTLKKPQQNCTHAIVLNMDTCIDEKQRQIWLHYKSDESATNARKALYTLISIANGTSAVNSHDEKREESLVTA